MTNISFSSQPLTSLFRVNASGVDCPVFLVNSDRLMISLVSWFLLTSWSPLSSLTSWPSWQFQSQVHGTYSFSYSRGHGVCDYPLSSLHQCQDWHPLWVHFCHHHWHTDHHHQCQDYQDCHHLNTELNLNDCYDDHYHHNYDIIMIIIMIMMNARHHRHGLYALCPPSYRRTPILAAGSDCLS